MSGLELPGATCPLPGLGATARHGRWVLGGAALVAWLAAPMPALGHSLTGRLDSPLPLAVYLGGAAFAVALSFAFALSRTVRVTELPPGRVMVVPRWLALGLRAIGLVAWLWIVAQAIVGGSSEADVSTLFLWVYGWVGLALLSAFVGPVWAWLDPFATLFDLGAVALRRLGVRGRAPASYPARLGAWPAVAGLAFVVWLELAYAGPGLGLILVGYTVLTLLAMARFGRDSWRVRAETFAVWFGTLNRLAPFTLDGPPDERRVRRRRFAVGLLEPGWTAAHVALVAIGTGSIIYDGLSQTQFWFGLFGLPSLSFSTVLLMGFLAMIATVMLAVGRLVGPPAIGAGLVPIAIGYLVAHYLTYLFGDGQRIVVALSDPLQLGWDLLGSAFYRPTVDWIPPAVLWTVMVVSVVGGHVIGAWFGHVVAVREAPREAGIRTRQLPLAIVMVALTATTLWSLGQAVVREPDASSSASVAVARVADPGLGRSPRR